MRRTGLLGLVLLTVALAACEGLVAAIRPEPGTVKIRVIHDARNAPPLDVYLTAPGASLAGAHPLVEPFTFGVDTTRFSGFVERDPGDYEMRFTDDGTTNVVLSTGTFTTAAGQLVTVVLTHDALGGLMTATVSEVP
jgi:hypothetical protein